MDEKKFLQYLAKKDRQIGALYDRFLRELAGVGLSIDDIPADRLFSFSDYPQKAKDIAKLLSDYSKKMFSIIEDGIKTAVSASNTAISSVLTGFSSMSDKMVREHTENVSRAFILSRTTAAKGLSLSQKTWNYTSQMKAEFEMGLSEVLEDGIASGISAEELGRKVRDKLQRPDSVYRRYHLKKVMNGTRKDVVEWRRKTVDADGKVHFMSTDIEHPGAGVYRSSRKNALRLCATEINMAYRYADCRRWQEERFVLGIRIRLSANHTLNGRPFHDMCDELAGDYPKWFLWKGWHPNCRCSASSILMDEDERERYLMLPKVQRERYVSPNLIKDMPGNYNDYIDANMDRIMRATEKGTTPYWIQDNYIDGDVTKGFSWSIPEPDGIFELLDESGRSELAVLNGLRAKSGLPPFLASDVFVEKKDKDGNVSYMLSPAKVGDTKLVDSVYKLRYVWNYLDGIDGDTNDLGGRGQTIRNATADYRRRAVAIITSGGKLALAPFRKMVETARAERQAVQVAWNRRRTLRAAEIRHANRDEAAIRQALYVRNNITKSVRNQMRIINDAVSRGLVNGEKLGYYDVRVYGMNSATPSFYISRTSTTYEQDELLEKIQAYVDKYSQMLVTNNEYGRRTKRINDYINSILTVEAIEEVVLDGKSQVGITRRINTLVKEAVKEREEVRKMWEARSAANQGRQTAPKQKKTLADVTSYEELVEVMGDNMPVELQDYLYCISRESYTDPDFLRKRDEIERKMRDYFRDKVDFGHWAQGNLLESYFNKGMLNTFETGTSNGYNGSTKTTGPIESGHSRLRWAHFAFGRNGSYTDRVPDSKQWSRKDYYRCGTPFVKDKTLAFKEQSSWGYGDVQIRFRRDKVITTFTLDNSLSTSQIPSLTCDPKVVSFDRQWFSGDKYAKFDNPKQIKGSWSDYIELQYHIPKNEKMIGPECMESITLPYDPTQYAKDKGLPADLWQKYHNKGVGIFYYDKNKDQVVELILETPEQRRARILAAVNAAHARRDADLASKGITREERIRQIQAERQRRYDEAKKAAEKILANAASLEDADVSLAEARRLFSEGDYLSARRLAVEAEATHRANLAIENKLKDLIPDVHDWHKKFTIAELQGAYDAVQRSISRIISRAGSTNYDEILRRLDFERGYVIDPGAYRPGAQRHSTWEVARNAYDKKISEYQTLLKVQQCQQQLDSFKAFNLTSPEYKRLLAQAQTELLAKDVDGAEATFKLLEAEKIRLTMEDMAKGTRHGSSSQYVVPDELLSQAEMDNALWFQDEAHPQRAFNAADREMSRYAEYLWSKLSDEEKHVLYLYTSGSRYINEPLYGHYYSATKYSPIDYSQRQSRPDINTLTDIIEKAKGLEHAMWVQHATDSSAIYNMFGVNLYYCTESEAQQLVGKVGTNSCFMSTSCAKYSFFTQIDKVKGTALTQKEVVLSIFLPKGTKGAYCEPVSHYGDGKTPYGSVQNRYQEKGYTWDGAPRQDAGYNASDQVEFLLQRGAKLRITKVVKNGGIWYIDCALIEQTAVSAF